MNFSFGSAFGAYIGIILATKDLDDVNIILIMALVTAVSAWLMYYHDAVEKIVETGFKKNAWIPAIFFTQVIALQIFADAVWHSVLVAIRVFQAWTLMLLVITITYIFALRRRHD